MPSVPELGAIQRANVILASLIALAMLIFVSRSAALSCLLGAAVVMGNLFLLSLLGRLLLAGAAGGASSALGAIALPLKLVLVAGLIYLVFYRSGIDGVGFALGVMTQLLAVLVETARANFSRAVSGSGV